MSTSPFRRNIPLFIAFRVLFNARWYYPVLAVLFLDFGLTLEQYALLNVVWAAAIVGLEVPSGALADHLGRKRMVVFATILMVIEMAVFAFAPREQPTLLFILFLINRVLSGAAEASASGADEALAYDSLASEGREAEWPHVLERVMRWQSAAFFATMMLGAIVYDAAFLQSILDRIGVSWTVTQEMSIRFPLYLTLMNAILALFVALSLREPSLQTDKTTGPASPWTATLNAGRWILATPIAMIIILAGLCFDSILRLLLTFASTYYRVIDLPTATFGLIGSGFALIGFFVPSLARRLVATRSMRANILIVAIVILIGLIGIATVWPIYGLIWLLPIGAAMSLTHFFISHYLNEQITDSGKRATVLSFRGLAYNLGYGGVGLLFAGLTRYLNAQHDGSTQDELFIRALAWLPWYFAATILLLAFVARRKNVRIS